MRSINHRMDVVLIGVAPNDYNLVVRAQRLQETRYHVRNSCTLGVLCNITTKFYSSSIKYFTGFGVSGEFKFFLF